jgi:hypothetical protein
MDQRFGFVEFVAMGDDEAVTHSVAAGKMDFSTVSHQRAVVVIAPDPNHLSHIRLPSDELEGLQILLRYIGVGAIDNVTVENELVALGKTFEEMVYQVRM